MKCVEVLVVAVCIGVLVALLLPAVSASREAARRTQCNNNLKNIVLSLQNYHDTFRLFPMGAMHSGPNPGGNPPITAGLGPSWWFGTVPFLEISGLYEAIDRTQSPGGPVNHQFCADDMNAAGVPLTLNPGPFDCMRCPSSRLAPMQMTCTGSNWSPSTGSIVLPSYVGIAGGCDIDPVSHDYQVSGGALAGLVAPKTDNVYHNKYKGTGAAAGSVVTSSGVLPPCQHVKLQDCTDGASNTMVVAEQSDWLVEQDDPYESSPLCHGDPGWTPSGTGPGGGWLSGTRRVDPVPKIDTPGGPPAPWGADCWNITTVRYPPNFKRVLGHPPLPGCSENHGINNPLQSPHPGGLLVGMADASVQFISQTVDLEVLLRLAIRDDGVTPPLP